MGRNKPGLGRALQKSRFKGKNADEGEYEALRTNEVDIKTEKAKRLESVTQLTDVEEVSYFTIRSICNFVQVYEKRRAHRKRIYSRKDKHCRNQYNKLPNPTKRKRTGKKRLEHHTNSKTVRILTYIMYV
jgi:hypothetical protein